MEPAESTPVGAVRIDGRLTQGDLAAMVSSSRQSIVILAPDRLASRARL